MGAGDDGLRRIANYATPLMHEMYGLPLAAAAATLTTFLLGGAAGIAAGGVLAVRGASHEGLIALALPILQIGHIYSQAGWHSFADGDRPLALCFGGMGIAFAAWLGERGRGWLGLAMLGAAGAMLVKNEALIGLAVRLRARQADDGR